MHKSFEDPPDLPAFKPPEPKRRRESLTEALSGAAVAFAGAINKQQTPPTQEEGHSSTPHSSYGQGVSSPRKAVELRMKNYEQLCYIQQLYNDGILDEKEFNEQKSRILDFIRKTT